MSDGLEEARGVAGQDGGAPGVSGPEASEWLLPLEAAGQGRRTGTKRVGGKAAALGRLLREGFPVPRGWVIDARRFERDVEDKLPRGHDVATLIKLAHTRAGVDRAARARDHILAMEMPAGLDRALDALWEAVGDDAPWGLAVRSSATSEDGEETSLAGLASTVLGVRGPEALAGAVRRVWASAFLPRALAYLAHAGVRDLAMAVVLQIMVRAEAAGVLFTAPPPGLEGEHWRPGERLINATLGLGAPVVDGAAVADTVRIARGGATAPAVIVADKRRALVVGAAGLEEVGVPELRARAPALSPGALRALAVLADRLEEASATLFKTGRAVPLDVEFAVEAAGEGASPLDDWDARLGGAGGPRVWILQARPITGGGFPEGGDAGTVWSRANVGEALPGPATPLTWSIARAFSDKGFQEAFGALGCHVPRDAHLVGNVQGRFYLNLSAFMQIAAQVPFLGPRALLTASGGASEVVIEALERQIEDVSRRSFLLRLPFTVPRQLARQARLEREVEGAEAEIDRARRRLFDMDLGILPDDGLATTLQSTVALLDRTGTLMLACASASLGSHLALCRVLEHVGRRSASPARGPGRGARRAIGGAARIELGRGRADRAGARGRRARARQRQPGPRARAGGRGRCGGIRPRTAPLGRRRARPLGPARGPGAPRDRGVPRRVRRPRRARGRARHAALARGSGPGRSPCWSRRCGRRRAIPRGPSPAPARSPTARWRASRRASRPWSSRSSARSSRARSASPACASGCAPGSRASSG